MRTNISLFLLFVGMVVNCCDIIDDLKLLLKGVFVRALPVDHLKGALRLVQVLPQLSVNVLDFVAAYVWELLKKRLETLLAHSFLVCVHIFDRCPHYFIVASRFFRRLLLLLPILLTSLAPMCSQRRSVSLSDPIVPTYFCLFLP